MARADQSKIEPDRTSQRVRIALGSDADGYRIKEKLALLLREDRHSVKDHGAHNEDPGDYPDIVQIVCGGVLADDADFGILVCGSGGCVMVANKVPGIRAILAHDVYTARQSRRQEDANVLCVGSRVVGPELVVDIARAWIGTAYSGDERHDRVLGQLAALDVGYEEERRELQRRLEDGDKDGG